MPKTEKQEWLDGFLMVGNQPALDLLNTSLVSGGRPVELLTDTEALARWCIAAGLLQVLEQREALRVWSGSEEARAFLRELLTFRERLRTAVLKLEKGKTPGTEFLTELNEMLRSHPLRASIAVRKGRLEQQQGIGLSVPDSLWAVLAAKTLALFTAVEPSRIRKCESCVVHFADVSKKGSRRWCSMNLCGNKVKVAAYQRRRSS